MDYFDSKRKINSQIENCLVTIFHTDVNTML